MIVNDRATVNLGSGCYAPVRPGGNPQGEREGEGGRGVRVLYSYRHGKYEMGLLAPQMRWAPPMGSAVPTMVPEAHSK